MALFSLTTVVQTVSIFKYVKKEKHDTKFKNQKLNMMHTRSKTFEGRNLRSARGVAQNPGSARGAAQNPGSARGVAKKPGSARGAAQNPGSARGVAGSHRNAAQNSRRNSSESGPGALGAPGADGRPLGLEHTLMNAADLENDVLNTIDMELDHPLHPVEATVRQLEADALGTDSEGRTDTPTDGPGPDGDGNDAVSFADTVLGGVGSPGSLREGGPAASPEEEQSDETREKKRAGKMPMSPLSRKMHLEEKLRMVQEELCALEKAQAGPSVPVGEQMVGEQMEQAQAGPAVPVGEQLQFTGGGAARPLLCAVHGRELASCLMCMMMLMPSEALHRFCFLHLLLITGKSPCCSVARAIQDARGFSPTGRLLGTQSVKEADTWRVLLAQWKALQSALADDPGNKSIEYLLQQLYNPKILPRTAMPRDVQKYLTRAQWERERENAMRDPNDDGDSQDGDDDDAEMGDGDV